MPGGHGKKETGFGTSDDRIWGLAGWSFRMWGLFHLSCDFFADL